MTKRSGPFPGWRRLRPAALAAAGLLAALGAWAGNTVYWISPQSNLVIDGQVAAEIAAHGDLVVLRSPPTHPDPDYSYTEVVRRLKAAGNMPVLAYGFSNRKPTIGRIEATILEGARLGAAPLASANVQGNGETDFIDVTNEGVRREMIRQYVAARTRLGVDGFALDLTVRTPSQRPAVLAKRCAQEASFCPRYAAGMDKFFDELQQALGSGTYLAYNGLFNFEPGSIADQARLLQHTNAAAVEYFGLDPNETEHSFSRDVKPFLTAIRALPKDKSVLVFGRGPWSYTDYAEDYRWQRYLYGAFLLEARGRDMFKYHASFQVPAHRGRAGGLDRYADWTLKLGSPEGPSRPQGGLLVRDYDRGLVIVAPDDGPGGRYTLAKTMYTPEGERLSGSVSLAAGEALILVDAADRALTRPDRLSITPAQIAGWRWEQASLKGGGAGAMVELQPLSAELTGEHDVLLDVERSLTPYERLEVRTRLAGDARILAVAEVDDSQDQYDSVIVEIGAGGTAGRDVRLMTSVPFRSRAARVDGETWPVVPGGRVQGNLAVVDGPAVLAGTRFQFRRWSHLRLVGPLGVGDITLSRPGNLTVASAAPAVPRPAVRPRDQRGPASGRILGDDRDPNQ